MSTETEIANRALSLLGEPAINALDDGTAPAPAITAGNSALPMALVGTITDKGGNSFW